MNQDNPLLLIALTLGVGYIAYLWIGDWKAAREGALVRGAFPGATTCALRAVVLAVAGALVLLTVEIFGEYRLGLVGEQRTITVLSAIYTLVAAFGEELVFRGYLVVTRRGTAVLWASAIGFSLLFAAAHPFLWSWEDGITVTPSAKAWFTTVMLFAGSLWFYWVRFQPWNPSRSLLPCIAAHLAKNIGVVVVKAAQGFVVGWW